MINNQSKSLNFLKKGQTAVIENISGANQELQNKLLTLGMVQGSNIEVKSIAPLGDPITIRVKGFDLSLRLREASQVLVSMITPAKGETSSLSAFSSILSVIFRS